MGPLTVALEQLLLDKIANSGMIGNKSKARFGPLALSALLAFIGACFLIAAAYIWMLDVYTSDIATALTGVLIMFLGAMIALVWYSVNEYKKSRVSHYTGEFTDLVQSLFGALSKELEEPIRDNPKIAVALSILAGFLVAKNIV